MHMRLHSDNIINNREENIIVKRKIIATFMIVLMLLLPVNFAIALDSTYGGDGTAGSGSGSSSSEYPKWASSTVFVLEHSCSENQRFEFSINGANQGSTICFGGSYSKKLL